MWLLQWDVYHAAAAAKTLQSCPTLRNPIDGNPPGSVPGILQARTLEWVTISFSSAWKWNMKVKSLSRAWLLVTPWTAAHQAPLSMGFSRQEYWSGVAFSMSIGEGSDITEDCRLCSLSMFHQASWPTPGLSGYLWLLGFCFLNLRSLLWMDT